MQEHMRIGLLDPRWLEQRDRSIREKQSDDEVYAPGQLVPLARLASSSSESFCERFSVSLLLRVPANRGKATS